MSAVPLPYRAAVRAAYWLAPIFARGSSKLARGIRGRRSAHDVLASWGEHRRDPARLTVWIHAPSAGEGLQAQAVLEALAQRRPGLQVAFTYFSPSAERLAGSLGEAVSAYLPWDIEALVASALDGVRPDLLIFTKTEVWPVLVSEATRRGVPVAIVAASVPPGAGRSRGPARALLRPTWGRLSAALASTDEDASMLVGLGVPAEVVRTTGDPGIDSAASRAVVPSGGAPYLTPFLEDPRPTVVAGSTWPADERVLFPALDRVRASVPELRVIVAPHEPDETLVAELLGRLQGLGWTSVALTAAEANGLDGATAVVVDRVGVLASLYTVADVAYVGGGYHRAGLHSVLEPAAAAAPVVFGPRHRNARAAAALVAAGGARVARDSARLAECVIEWLTSEREKRGASAAAIGYIDAHRGAADRTAALLDPLLDSRRPA